MASQKTGAKKREFQTRVPGEENAWKDSGGECGFNNASVIHIRI